MKYIFLILIGLVFSLPSYAQDITEIFEEVEYFEEKSAVWQLGIGFRSDINLKERAVALDGLDIKPLIPALSLTYDKNVWQNLGIGFTLGGQLWNVEGFDYQYRYYTGAVRASYHFNIFERLDPYVGLGGTFRYLEIGNGTGNNNSNIKATSFFMLGTRYYFADKTAVVFELANDATTWYKLGIAWYID